MMRRIAIVIAVWMLIGLPAAAQEIALPRSVNGIVPTQGLSFPEPQPLHVTDYLSERPEAQASLREFHTRKERGRVPEAATRLHTYAPGDTRTFTAYNFQTQERDEIDFTLRLTASGFRIWVETEELDLVSMEELDALRRALAEETPSGSIDSERGILRNNESTFGTPPNVDGDGRIDILMLDIRDNFHPEDRPQFVAGFVDPTDLTDRGNNRDVMYLDVRPGLVRPDGSSRGIHRVAATAAHEHQHLIHMNYDLQEVTFVNEGLSEWGEVLNGYPRRPMSYLHQTETYNVSLLRWRPRGTSDVLDDYERAGLLTTYLSERLGVETTGSITRDPQTGVDGYRNAAAEHNEQLHELLLDFHVANYVNSAQVGPGLGYDRTPFHDVHALPGQRTDGRTAAGYSGRVGLEPGGVQYLKWAHVEDFTVELDGGGPLRARALLYRDGNVTLETVPVGLFEHTFSGSYDRIVLVLAHTNPDADPLTAAYDATWFAETYYRPETLAYDDSTAQRYIRGRGHEVLTRFTNPLPSDGFLAQIELPVYYFSQFSNEDAPPPEALRAFTLVIREVAEDGSPGDELFTLNKNDPRPYSTTSGLQLQYLDIDLTDHADQLRTLPETVFIGFRDVAGTQNEVVFPTAEYTHENHSYRGTAGEWECLWEVMIEREEEEDLSLDQTVIPIRATYFAPTDDPPLLTDDPLPPQIALSPNAPNPFTSTSRLSFSLPHDMPARLEVYDVVGRRMAVLRDGVQLGGEHTVVLDGRAWASGVYVVTLTTEGDRISRKVVVIR